MRLLEDLEYFLRLDLLGNEIVLDFLYLIEHSTAKHLIKLLEALPLIDVILLLLLCE